MQKEEFGPKYKSNTADNSGEETELKHAACQQIISLGPCPKKITKDNLKNKIKTRAWVALLFTSEINSEMLNASLFDWHLGTWLHARHPHSGNHNFRSHLIQTRWRFRKVWMLVLFYFLFWTATDHCVFVLKKLSTSVKADAHFNISTQPAAAWCLLRLWGAVLL